MSPRCPRVVTPCSLSSGIRWLPGSRGAGGRERQEGECPTARQTTPLGRSPSPTSFWGGGDTPCVLPSPPFRLSPQGKAGQAGQTGQRGPPVRGRGPHPELGVMGGTPGCCDGGHPWVPSGSLVGLVVPHGDHYGVVFIPQGPLWGRLCPTVTTVGLVLPHRDHCGVGFIPQGPLWGWLYLTMTIMGPVISHSDHYGISFIPQ